MSTNTTSSTDQVTYEPGAVANGYRLAADGTTWEPVDQVLPATQPEKKKRGWLKWAAIGAGGLLALSVAMNGLGGESPSQDVVAEPEPAAEAPATDAEALVTDAEAPAADEVVDSTTSEASSEQTAPETNVTVAQENALRSAESYLEFTGFSRQGLIDQLSSEYGDGYTVEDATWAVDQLTVDWNEQAVRSAESYLEFTGFSRQGLIDQLSSEYGDKYTVEEATYAADQVGL